MEIRTDSPPAPVPSATPMKPGGTEHQAQRDKRVPPVTETKADNKARPHRQRAEAQTPAPTFQGVRLELRIDEATNQVFGRVIDRETGEEVRQIPAESIRHLQAISRELFDSLFDETV
ncbi:MAG TPA: flagellar protein FlaG [Alphaproteobacteria bacterium]|nr:flagellar protein FlaG [Alphaproteobacteria bacterium]